MGLDIRVDLTNALHGMMKSLADATAPAKPKLPTVKIVIDKPNNALRITVKWPQTVDLVGQCIKLRDLITKSIMPGTTK